MSSPNPVDYFAIQNTLARYCIALDTKDFTLFDQIFTPDVDAIYPFRSAMKGAQELAAAIEQRHHRLTHITSQHALTTQMIEIDAGGTKASAVTYFTGIHFGKGTWQGKEVTAWGKYVDSLVLVEGEGALPGARGRWLICRRETVFMGRLGEEGVMDGE
ncbi:Hypothetical protein R9X50_00212700 [Acrodontium crateriforme]|uniref:SnoaL-like domain-containing protein n=1 Tax=Acrodontium crateriforme TaxID=150365 RepID=A0AAQ3M1X4_9PEZI|nr:Hypothetical protein R9X50_00212700 [Acrodontium crateriforme]